MVCDNVDTISEFQLDSVLLGGSCCGRHGESGATNYFGEMSTPILLLISGSMELVILNTSAEQYVCLGIS